MIDMIDRMHYFLDWLFKDFSGRRGKYVIAEVPNAPLLVFMGSVVIAVLVYPGFFQSLFAIIAYIALAYWGFLELRSGRSRFRRLLGWLGLAAVAGAVILRLGL